MDAERNSWTDDRLDDFRRDVDKRFDAAHRRFDDFRQSVDKRFDEVNQRMDAGFARVDAKFDALQRVLIQVGWTLAAAMLTMLASMLGLFITQL